MPKYPIVKNILLSFALATTPILASAGRFSWEFKTTQYNDYQGALPSIASGILIASDLLNSKGQYEILSVTGYYGADPIIGLGTRSSRPGDQSYLVPDNAVSLNRWDATNGCQGIQPMWNDKPHFSCAGASFKTTIGYFNLAWAGAVPVVLDYQGQWLFARHQIIQTTTAVPEPASTALLVAGLLLLLAKRHQKIRHQNR